MFVGWQARGNPKPVTLMFSTFGLILQIGDYCRYQCLASLKHRYVRPSIEHDSFLPRLGHDLVLTFGQKLTGRGNLIRREEVKMSQSMAFETDDRMAHDWAKESVSQIAASMTSRLAKSREAGGAILADPQMEEFVAAIEDRCAYAGFTPDKSEPAIPVALRMPQEPRTTGPNADEYRGRVDACLAWAGEAPTDEVRLACLTLAQAWLKAAMRQSGDISDHLPLAPTL